LIDYSSAKERGLEEMFQLQNSGSGLSCKWNPTQKLL